MMQPPTKYEFKVWTDDFITINMKSNSTSPSFLIEIRLQECVQYLPKKGDSIVEEPRGPFIVESFYLPRNAVIRDAAAADDSICEILTSVGVPLPIIRQVSAFARAMISQPGYFKRPLLPVVIGIAVNCWVPRDAPAIPQDRIKEERVCFTPFLGIRYKVEE